MELFVQILFYMISNSLPEVCAWGQEETISLSRLLRYLSDSRSLLIINTVGGGEKVVKGEDDDDIDNKDFDITHV